MRQPVEEAARFLASHADEPVRLDELADHVGYSPFHLARSFERHLGVPPGQFQVAHRFQRAKQLLLEGDDRIVDVCHAVGFNSLGTFTSRFTETVAMTPTEFRRLPHVLAAAPARPILLKGDRPGGAVVSGSVRLSDAAKVALDGDAAIYVGLFRRRAARGLPVSGELLARGSTSFELRDVAPGTYYLLASALPARGDAPAQLLPVVSAVGSYPHPLQIPSSATARAHLSDADVEIDLAQAWSAPVLVALPALASQSAQDRRRRRAHRHLG